MTTKDTPRALGRDPAPDPRDTAYRLADHVDLSPRGLRAAGAEPVSKKYHFANGFWGDQGIIPACVGFAWTHWVEDGPTTHMDRSPDAPPVRNPVDVYLEAQNVDEWEGNAYAGTSVRAGAKVLQADGLIGSYYWAWTLEDALAALAIQPVVVGTWWYSSMWETDGNGLLKVSGEVVGGHAYVVNGYNRERKLVRIKNSWGRAWGLKGHAYLSFDDFERLLSEDGECAFAEERERA